MGESKKRRGRPKKDGTLDDGIFIRMTAEDKAKLRILSARAGIPLRVYCRNILLPSDGYGEESDEIYDELYDEDDYYDEDY